MKYYRQKGELPWYLVVADLLNAGVPPSDIAIRINMPVDNVHTLAGYARRKGLKVKDYRLSGRNFGSTRVTVDKYSIPTLLSIAQEHKMSVRSLVITLLRILETEETLVRNLLEIEND